MMIWATLLCPFLAAIVSGAIPCHCRPRSRNLLESSAATQNLTAVDMWRAGHYSSVVSPVARHGGGL